MELEEWMKIYEKILEDFGFKREDDEMAAKFMKDVAGDKLLDCSVLDFIRGKSVAIVGGVYEGEKIEEEVVITAGKAVKKVKFTPHVHVTDIEEEVEILRRLQESGCILVLHAHGDNVNRIREVIPALKRFVGTTQSTPFDRIYNFGGFTDGDRAALIAKKFGASRIKLYGFDFSKADNQRKLKKLKWAKIILELEGII